MAKKKRKPRRKATSEAHVRQFIARHERLQQAWLAKLSAATTQVKKHSSKIKYYNLRLAKLAERREGKAIRSIDLENLE